MSTRGHRRLRCALATALLALVCASSSSAQTFPIDIDATELSYEYVIVDGNFYLASSVHTLSLSVGAHLLTINANAVPAPSIAFTVDSSGAVDFSAALDGFVSGRGTDTLALDGFAVVVDGASLSYAFLLINWIPGGFATNDVAVPLRLLPGAHRLTINAGVAPAPAVTWTVSASGTIDFDSALDGPVSGRGTDTLLLAGVPITIDGTATSYEFFLFGWLDPQFPPNDGVFELQLLPGAHRVAINAGAVARVDFTVAAAGSVDYAAALDTYVSGRGTGALVFDGLVIEVDATDLPPALTTFSLTGFIEGDVTTVETFTLLAGIHRLTTSDASFANFELFPDGTCVPTELTLATGTVYLNCPPAVCGDGTVNGDEACDDANALPGDGCRADCTEELCGDSILDPGEQCDDGNVASGDGCQANCALPVCGDGIPDAGEQCDDGNLIGGDGCSDTCHTEVCGNATVDPGEQCDDGNAAAGDGCRANCTQELCGDGVLDPQESCDDANNDAGDGCRADCTTELCGDGVQDPQEQCDDGNTQSGDGCQAGCVLPLCGDGVVDAGEQCDDGNTGAGDGCSATCALEICGNGILDPGELCDDGNTAPADGCRANCTIEICGDGTLDPQEQCDDGNTVSGDGCSAACAIEQSSGDEGCRPRFWRTHLADWPSAYPPSTPFASVFENAFPGMSLVQVLRQKGGGLKSLGRQTVAALLNAASSDVDYELAPSEVVAMFNDTYPGTKRAYNTLRKNFRQLNRQGCPLVPPQDDWCEDDEEEDD